MTEALVRSGHVANRDTASYNFHTPVCRTDSLCLRELESLYWRLMFVTDLRWIVGALKGVIFERDPRRRRIQRALRGKSAQIAGQALARLLLHPLDPKPTLFSRRPPWYNT